MSVTRPVTRLNLGSGLDREPGYHNVDVFPWEGVDEVTDLDKAPWPWPEDSVSRIRAFDVWEHVADPCLFMRESWQVLKPGGLLDIHTVAAWADDKGILHASPNWTRDPTHRRASDFRSFDYWVSGTYLNQRYGPMYTGGFAVFEYATEPHLVDGFELAVLLRKPLAVKA